MAGSTITAAVPKKNNPSVVCSKKITLKNSIELWKNTAAKPAIAPVIIAYILNMVYSGVDILLIIFVKYFLILITFDKFILFLFSFFISNKENIIFPYKLTAIDNNIATP